MEADNLSTEKSYGLLANLARAYVYLLFVSVTLALLLLVSFSISTRIGIPLPVSNYFDSWARGFFVVAAPAISLAKEKNVWENEFKTCPLWAKIVGFPLAAFGFISAASGLIQAKGVAFPEEAIFSAFFISFLAGTFCVISSVLWSGTVDKKELVKRTGISLTALALVILVLSLPKKHH